MIRLSLLLLIALSLAGPQQALAGEIEALDLDAFRGNVVVVEFMATWCSACRKAAPTIAGWQEELAEKGLTVIAASKESPALLRRFRDATDLQLTLAHDPGGRVARAHRVTAYPTFIVFDREGNVRGRFVGGGRSLKRVQKAFEGLLDQGGGGQDGMTL